MMDEAAARERPIRIVLVDDQELVRSGLQRILRLRDGFEVVAECADGSEVEAAVRRSRPDVVLMDLRMRDIDGITATARLKNSHPDVPVLVLTTFDDDQLLSGALRAGAAGFVLKDTSAEDLIRSVRAVADGGAWLDPAVTGRVLAAYRSVPEPAPDHADPLTPREVEVLQHMAGGLTNAEIGDALHISEVTVKSHVGHIFTKLDLRDRAAAIIWAFDHRLVTPR